MFERRYHNIFYAVRGQASGDPLGASPRQLENQVTKALVNTLEHSEPEVTSRFIEELTSIHTAASTFEYELEAAYLPDEGGQTCFLGLSPAGRVDPGTLSSPIGGVAWTRLSTPAVTPGS